MCGIVGFFDKKDKLSFKEREDLIKEMVKTIEHRGLDDRGFYIDGQIAIGHTRLSILDLSKKGAQPFFDSEKKTVLSYNGEIYNFKKINYELEKKYKLKTDCDTETLLYSYLDQGEVCLDKLEGMFAFSIFEREKQKIFLAVDRFSIKPLYYIDNEEWFAWSSEIKSLLLLPDFKIQLNTDKLYEYLLFRQTAGRDTLLQGIKRVLPAEKINYDLRSKTIERKIYWHLNKKDFSIKDWEQEIAQKLELSINEHLLADVPVGVQLSGGVDSSLVAAISTFYKKGLNTYSIGLEDKDWNEFRYSREVADKFKTIHHEILFSEKEFCEYLPSLTFFHDEPISHSHSIPMFILAKNARKDVKVLLSGEGADEVFLGYKRYLKLFQKENITDEDILFSNSYGNEDNIRKILKCDFDRGLSFRKEVLQEASDCHWTQKISLYDLKTYLPPLLLRQDKMGMATNLENRVPFLDHHFVELGFSMPTDLKINSQENKIILKKIATKFLPQELIYRKKCGFGQPIGRWLKNKDGLGRFLGLIDGSHNTRDFLNYDYINKIIVDHCQNNIDNTETLWTLINLELWLKIYIDGWRPEMSGNF